jgi:hypothetical protein
MSPTIALKFRLANSTKTNSCSSRILSSLGPTTTTMGTRSNLLFPSVQLSAPTSRNNQVRSVSIGSDPHSYSSPIHLVPEEYGEIGPPEEEEEDDEDNVGVQLLLGIATIVSKEIASSNTEIFDDEEEEQQDKDDQNHDVYDDDNTRHRHPVTSSSSSYPAKERSLESPSSFNDEMFAWNRIRTVSMDSPNGQSSKVQRHHPHHHHLLSLSSSPHVRDGGTSSAIVTPVRTRLRSSACSAATVFAGGTSSSSPRLSIKLKMTPHKGKKEGVKFPKLPHLHELQRVQVQQQVLPSIAEHKQKAMEVCNANGRTIKKIMRKKFSWKNYPGKQED